MKKLLLSVAVLATVFTSCEKEANVVGTGTLKLNAVVENTNNQTLGKNVTRGNIPVYVKNINTEVLDGTTVVASENFILTGDLTATDPGEFFINDVPSTLTNGTVSATSEANVAEESFSMSEAFDASEIATIKGGLIAKTPFIEYSGSQENFNMNAGENNQVSVNMFPQQGRDMGIVNNVSSYTCKVTMTTEHFKGSDHDNAYGKSYSKTVTVKAGEALSYYVSDEKWAQVVEGGGEGGSPIYTSDGAGVNLVVVWYDAQANEVARYDRRDSNLGEGKGWFNIAAHNGTSFFTTWNITDAKVDKETVEATFNFTPVVEEDSEFDI